MQQILIVGIGGFIGAILRYMIGGWAQQGHGIFPVGTMTVNIAGSFFLGLVMGITEVREVFSVETRIFLTIGVLGAFTTMSAFSYDSFKLLEQKELLYFVVNVVGTVALTLFAVYMGRAAAPLLGRA